MWEMKLAKSPAALLERRSATNALGAAAAETLSPRLRSTRLPGPAGVELDGAGRGSKHTSYIDVKSEMLRSTRLPGPATVVKKR